MIYTPHSMASPTSATTSANDEHETNETIPNECAFCLQPIVNQRMIQPCDCCASKWCSSCLEYDFDKAATRKGYFKPPRCCYDIQLFKVLGRLDSEIASIYRARYKEYITRVKICCPAPGCSAFIDLDLSPNCESHCDRPCECDFQCPHCGVRVCSDGCRQIAHEGPCDMVAQMQEAEMLAQFKIKQCPSCRRAVKRMYGCSNMRCTCGAYFCWYCCNPTEDCDVDCDQRSENNESFDDERGDNRDGNAGEENTPNTNVNNDEDKVQLSMDGAPKTEHGNEARRRTGGLDISSQPTVDSRFNFSLHPEDTEPPTHGSDPHLTNVGPNVAADITTVLSENFGRVEKSAVMYEPQTGKSTVSEIIGEATAEDAGDAKNCLDGEVRRDSILSLDTARRARLGSPTRERHQASNPDITDEPASSVHSPTLNDQPARSNTAKVRRAVTRPIDLDAGGSRRWFRAPEDWSRPRRCTIRTSMVLLSHPSLDHNHMGLRQSSSRRSQTHGVQPLLLKGGTGIH